MAVVQPGAPLDRSHDLASAALMKSDGTPVLGWLTYDKKTQYMRRCPIVRLDRARELVPKVLAEFPYLARMLDVDTNEDMYECFSPEHRMTRREKRAITNKTYGYMQSLGLVTGGEHGRWWAVPYVDYFEGMMTSSSAWAWPAGHLVRPKEKDFSKTASSDETRWGRYEKWAIGHQYRIPLWELVFHDCVVTTWYWGDTSDFLLTAAPEVTPKKDAFNVLYGTPAMLWANKEGSWTTARDVFLRSYRNTCKLHEAVGGTEMLSHEFLTPDRAAQRTRFSDGTVAVVNFGEKPYAVAMGGKKRLLPRNGFAVKGPRIEQYLELVDGRPVTSIRAPGYEFREPAERP
jgi:hypothetical protein